jgi:hypothetical protein
MTPKTRARFNSEYEAFKVIVFEDFVELKGQTYAFFDTRGEVGYDCI